MSKSLKITAAGLAFAGALATTNALHNVGTTRLNVQYTVQEEAEGQNPPPSEAEIKGLIFQQTLYEGVQENGSELASALLLDGIALGTGVVAWRK